MALRSFVDAGKQYGMYDIGGVRKLTLGWSLIKKNLRPQHEELWKIIMKGRIWRLELT